MSSAAAMHPYKGRGATPGQLVEVYRNLHTGRWSVRDAASGRVVAHADAVTLADARFTVREGGRQRVLRERRKNVHAWIAGRLSAVGPEEKAVRVGYNPYRAATFTDAAGTPVTAAAAVWLHEGGGVTATGVEGRSGW